jgi:hypothetical protein
MVKGVNIEEQQEALKNLCNKITRIGANCCAVLAALLYGHVPACHVLHVPNSQFQYRYLFLSLLEQVPERLH